MHPDDAPRVARAAYADGVADVSDDEWPATPFDFVFEQVFDGTLPDEDKYALPFECPGCGHCGTVRCSHPLRIEWDQDINGRCYGWLTCTSTDRGRVLAHH